MLIEINNIKKEYRRFTLAGVQSVHALNDVTFGVEQGSIFGLLGQNGAGKTTLIKLLMGLVTGNTGTITLFGEEPSVISRRRIGYLPENPQFPTHLSGIESLQFLGRLDGLSDQVCKNRALLLADELGIGGVLQRPVISYSKGMRQRLGLVQALIHNPELLILDEPTDGVDPLGRKSIRELLKRLQTEGKTIFINSHILSEVELVVDHAAILGKGKLLYQGKLDTLQQSGIEYRICLADAPVVIPDQVTAKFPQLRLQSDGVLVCSVADTLQLQELITELLVNGLQITELVKNKQSLEELYITLVEGGRP